MDDDADSRGVSDRRWPQARRPTPSKVVVAHATVPSLTQSLAVAKACGRRTALPGNLFEQVAGAVTFPAGDEGVDASGVERHCPLHGGQLPQQCRELVRDRGAQGNARLRLLRD